MNNLSDLGPGEGCVVVGWAGGAVALCLLAPSSAASRGRMRLLAWAFCLGGLGLWLLMSWIAG